jgi:hypothetical protein
MSNIITSNFRDFNAKNFVDSIGGNSVYCFIGRSFPWSDGFSDATPPTPVDSDYSTNVEQLKNAIALKRLSSSNVSIAVRRYNWAQNTRYEQYSISDKDILKKQFYVLTDIGNVYKCISNNNGANSTVKPTSTSPAVFSTADGYKWKYMYTISGLNAENFLTPYFMWCPNFSVISNIDAINNPENMPVGGHGSNVPRELGAYYVIVAAKFEDNESGSLSTSIDYRTIGLIKNPVLWGTENTAVGSFYNMATRIRFATNLLTDFVVGQEVTIQTTPSTKAYVVATGVVGSLDYIDVVGHNLTSIPAGTTVSSSTSTGSVGVVTNSPIRYDKGDVLSVEYRTPILRADGQVEALNIVLEF